VALS
jgi:phosphoribosyl-AMP cyclohydrolase